MKHELENIRNLARNQIESGVLPEHSWDRYVKLMEAVEAVLHEIAVQAPAASLPRPATGHPGLMSVDSAAPLAASSAEATMPARYQRRVYSLRRRTHSLQ